MHRVHEYKEVKLLNKKEERIIALKLARLSFVCVLNKRESHSQQLGEVKPGPRLLQFRLRTAL